MKKGKEKAKRRGQERKIGEREREKKTHRKSQTKRARKKNRSSIVHVCRTSGKLRGQSLISHLTSLRKEIKIQKEQNEKGKRER